MKPSWDIPFRYYVLVLLTFLLVIGAWQIREVFQPLVTAGLMAYLLTPLVNMLSAKTRLTRRVSANLVFFAALGILIAIPSTLVPILFNEMQALIDDLSVTLMDVQQMLSTPLTIAGHLQFDFSMLIPALEATVRDIPNTLPENALRLIENTSRGAAWFLVIVVSTYYLMVDWEHLREWFLSQPPEAFQPDIRRLYFQVKEVWMGYLRGQVLLMVIVAIVFTIVWSAIGLPGALVIGILTGLFSLVPEIGPLTATVLAVLVALLEGSNFLPLSNLWFAALVGIIYAVLINVKNIWLRPLIMGRSVNMHEGIVFIAIIAAVIFQGILGALIVVPVLASMGVVGRYIRRRLLGLPPFDGDEIPELTPPSEKPKLPFRRNKNENKSKRKLFSMRVKS